MALRLGWPGNSAHETPMILTITLNPALDVSSSAPQVVPDAKLRCSAPVTDPGGGGVNVARAIRFLGGTATAMVALGGHSGARLLALLQDEQIDVMPFDTPGETRQSLAVMDDSSGLQYRFILPGPIWTTDLVDAMVQRLAQAAKPGMMVVLSGSQPPGVPEDFPQTLAKEMDARGARLILDTSGAPLEALRDGRLGPQHILRLDGAESAMLAGHPLPDRDALARFAKTLITKGIAGTVILAMGAEGSVLVNGAGAWHAVSPKVPVRSKVGAGDSFVGGFALALSRGQPAPEALRFGVAAASAAVISDATALCRKTDFDTLLPQITLNELTEL